MPLARTAGSRTGAFQAERYRVKKVTAAGLTRADTLPQRVKQLSSSPHLAPWAFGTSLFSASRCTRTSMSIDIATLRPKLKAALGEQLRLGQRRAGAVCRSTV